MRSQVARPVSQNARRAVTAAATCSGVAGFDFGGPVAGFGMGSPGWGEEPAAGFVPGVLSP